jgi:hypothetical protein
VAQFEDRKFAIPPSVKPQESAEPPEQDPDPPAHCLDDESFLARDPSQHLIGFLCECGCLGIVAKTRSEYESKGGAWIEGHESLQASA